MQFARMIRIKEDNVFGFKWPDRLNRLFITLTSNTFFRTVCMTILEFYFNGPFFYNVGTRKESSITSFYVE